MSDSKQSNLKDFSAYMTQKFMNEKWATAPKSTKSVADKLSITQKDTFQIIQKSNKSKDTLGSKPIIVSIPS